jgi:hypothetical protein
MGKKKKKELNKDYNAKLYNTFMLIKLKVMSPTTFIIPTWGISSHKLPFNSLPIQIIFLCNFLHVC